MDFHCAGCVLWSAAIATLASAVRPQFSSKLSTPATHPSLCGLELFQALDSESTLSDAKAQFLTQCEAYYPAVQCNAAAAELWQGQDHAAKLTFTEHSTFCQTLRLVVAASERSALLDNSETHRDLENAVSGKFLDFLWKWRAPAWDTSAEEEQAAEERDAEEEKPWEKMPASRLVGRVRVFDNSVGAASSGSGRKAWNIRLRSDATADEKDSLCKTSPTGCIRICSQFPFIEMYATDSELDAVIRSSDVVLEFAESDARIHIPRPEEVSLAQIESQAASPSWGLDRIGAPTNNKGKGIVIWMVDTGVRCSHVDLVGRCVPMLDVSSGGTIECGEDLSCAPDVYGHGTHAAATAAGKTYGIAKKAKVKSVRVFDDFGDSNYGDMIYGMSWIADWNAAHKTVKSVALINSEGPKSGALNDATNSLVDSGVVVVTAAGNWKEDACSTSPASASKAITVGAIGPNDRIWGSSNYGPCVNIYAPGHRIVSANPYKDKGSITWSGTSFAGPHVLGAAAVLRQTSSPNSVKNKIIRQSEKGAVKQLPDTKSHNRLLDLRGF